MCLPFPATQLGATWGSLWGLIVRGWLPGWNVQPGLYALLAATGVLGGVFRSAISLVVLMVEGTRGIDYLFGVILAVVVANWMAHHIHHDGRQSLFLPGHRYSSWGGCFMPATMTHHTYPLHCSPCRP